MHHDGHEVWVSVSVSCVRDEQEQPLYLIGQVEDVTERRALRERLAYAAIHDPLTGLPNRELFMDRLEVALRRADTGEHQVAVIFLDLDRFKLINDSLGHDVGDQILGAVADRLEQRHAGERHPGPFRRRRVHRPVRRRRQRRRRPRGGPAAGRRPWANPWPCPPARSSCPSAWASPCRAPGESRGAVLAQRRHRHVPGQGARARRASRSTGRTTSRTSSVVSGRPTSCTGPSSATSWSSTTSPSSTSIPRRWWGWRRWCGGSIPPGACCSLRSSSPWPRTAASSCPWEPGS